MIKFEIPAVGTGFYGVSGESAYRSTKVHFTQAGRPICGAMLSPKQEYQWCSNFPVPSYVGCKNCKKIYSSAAKKLEKINSKGK